MKTIIVATDFSLEADNAMLYLAEAAAEHGFRIVLFNLYNVSIHAQNARVSSQSINDIFHRRETKIQDVAKSLLSVYKIKVSTHVASGDFYEELKRCITNEKADLVTMGMAQKSLEQDLLGNTTTAALHRLKFPVLAIPSTAQYKGIKNILFACDITRGVHVSILENVKKVASQFGAGVEVFLVRKRIEEISEEPIEMKVIKEGLSGIRYYFRNVASIQIIDAIHTEVKQMEADLLIMVPHKYGFWDSLVHRSKTRVMASESSVPLLSLPL